MINRIKNISADPRHLDEQAVWKLFKSGDKNSYASIYQQYSGLLFRYGRKLVHDREIIKDCIHDLFTDLWKNKGRLGNPPCVKNYLVKSFRNKLVRQIKRNLKIVYKGDDLSDHETGHALSVEYILINGEKEAFRKKRLTEALKKLTNRQKEIIFLLYYGDFSAQEVADMTSLSVRTVYNTVHNAIQQLRKELILLFSCCFFALFF